MLNSSTLSMITSGSSWGCLIPQQSLSKKTILGSSFFGTFIGESHKWMLFISLPCAFVELEFPPGLSNAYTCWCNARDLGGTYSICSGLSFLLEC